MTPDEIEKMKADIEAGTPGPWRASKVNPSRVFGPDNQPVMERDPSFRVAPRYEANARRIARVPQLEAEVLRLRRMLKDARQWNWIDFDEADDDEREGLTEMTFLDREISDTLSDGGDDAA